MEEIHFWGHIVSNHGVRMDLQKVEAIKNWRDLDTKADPPFIGIELDHSDSGREGCSVSTLTISAEPRDWRGAVSVAVQEVQRLKEFGVTKGELTRYMTALLKDSEHLAAMVDSVASVDNLNFIMENDALGHTVMDQRQGHECLMSVAQTVTLEDVRSYTCFLYLF
ncbi:hypothetical protein L7F22_057556 [Adiantum nelumboides]|nr:hypothetical protein [Adiantum nelumboides]